MDFTLIKRAGLTQREFSLLCGVSRVTANLWVRSKMAPHRLHEDRIATVLGSMGDAVEHARLPLPASVPKHQRLDAIRQALVQPQAAAVA